MAPAASPAPRKAGVSPERAVVQDLGRPLHADDGHAEVLRVGRLLGDGHKRPVGGGPVHAGPEADESSLGAGEGGVEAVEVDLRGAVCTTGRRRRPSPCAGRSPAQGGQGGRAHDHRRCGPPARRAYHHRAAQVRVQLGQGQSAQHDLAGGLHAVPGQQGRRHRRPRRLAEHRHVLAVDVQRSRVDPGPRRDVAVMVQQRSDLRSREVTPRPQHVVPVPPVQGGVGHERAEAGPEGDRAHQRPPPARRPARRNAPGPPCDHSPGTRAKRTPVKAGTGRPAGTGRGQDREGCSGARATAGRSVRAPRGS